MEAVFIKVLNMSISAGWLVLAVMLLRLLLKKAPKWISVVLWGIVGLRLVLPFSLQSAFSLIPSAEVVSPSIGYAQHPEINSGVSVIDNAVNPTLSTSLAATPMNSVNPMQIILYLGSLIWAVGIAILLLYGLISYLRLRRKVAEAVPYEKNTWLCDQVKTPFILGVFRPRIYLPSGLNEEETAYVLAHEHAHLRRKDHLWKPLGFLLLTIYWFNPLVWVAYILLCRDIEAACDEKVISDMEMTEKKAYANALINCSMQRRLILACPLAFGEVGVKERVKGVLNYRKPAFWIIVTALIVCAVIAVCFLTNPKEDGPDLSFLNYKNAITLIGQNDTAPYANLYPVDSDGVQPGAADAKALAQFLENAEWTKRRAPSSSPEPQGYLEFVIEDNYRIIVYQSERLAAVRVDNDIQYYRIGVGDYEAALAAFIPAPSTEPDNTPKPSPDASTSEQASPFTISSGGITVNPYCTLWYEKTWTENGWLIKGDPDNPTPAILPEDYDKIPTVTLADDFKVQYDHPQSYLCDIYDELFRPLRNSWYGNTGVCWLEPGTYYCVIPAWGPQGRYIESEVAYEEILYHCVCRLIVPDRGAEPYTPEKVAEKAVELTEARLHINDTEVVLTDAASLAKLEDWLKNAEFLPGSAGCPFGSILTLTYADGSMVSCCPAEDSCGVIFSNGSYYRYAHDNEAFWTLFGIQLR